MSHLLLANFLVFLVTPQTVLDDSLSQLLSMMDPGILAASEEWV